MAYLTVQSIDPSAEPFDPRDGASVEFLGVVRGTEQGREISGLTYESYPAMAEKIISRLVEEAKTRWPVHQAVVLHRTGWIRVGETAVFIKVQTPHREEAFAACRFLIDRIKEEAPIWKKVPLNESVQPAKRQKTCC